MYRKALLLVAVMIAAQMTLAHGQGGGMPYGFEFQEQQHKLEVQVIGGYVWTVSKDATISDGEGGFTSGSMDLTSGEYWGIEVDINIPKPGAQLALLYRRQETTVEWKQGGGVKRDIGDVAVEYWQIGMVGGVQKDKVMPFTMFTLGATHYDFKGENSAADDWNFSMIFGLGAKIYMSERIALRLQGSMPFTFTNGGAGVGCSFGGCYPTVGGTGIFQFDLTAGIAILI
jgi:opacity protein-like surface antigen